MLPNLIMSKTGSFGTIRITILILVGGFLSHALERVCSRDTMRSSGWPLCCLSDVFLFFAYVFASDLPGDATAVHI